MVTKIKLTIGDKTYRPGEKITQKLSKADEAFLRREGYIADEDKSQEKAPAGSKG